MSNSSKKRDPAESFWLENEQESHLAKDFHKPHEAHISDTWKSVDQGRCMTNVVAYIRVDQNHPDKREQLAEVEEYCRLHKCTITAVFEDKEEPAYGLSEAMEALRYADGMVAFDLNRFVEHKDDRLRDLRSLVHHFLADSNKRLIAVRDGVDTALPGGQFNALRLVSDDKDRFAV